MKWYEMPPFAPGGPRAYNKIMSMLTLPPAHRGLYVHVPFCVRKCRYCDFASFPLGAVPGAIEAYLDALAREAAAARATWTEPFSSIFIGGGTPTALTGAQLRRLWAAAVAPFPRTPDAEVTLEANPGTLTDDVLAVIADLPMTRVSLGAQSFLPEELHLLGRIHTPEEVEDGVRALRAAGIAQLNIDLMYAFPTQTPASLAHSLHRALALAPDHLSVYALILEEGTPLALDVAEGKMTVANEEKEVIMEETVVETLAAAGFERYEVSNYAQPGAICRQNLGYWLGREYLGLGPAAASYRAGVRWRQTADLAAYGDRVRAGVSPVEYLERLAGPAQLLERVMLGLRLCEGFALAEAETACGCTLRTVAGDTLDALIREEWLDLHDGRLRLTPRGFPLANRIMARLMAAGEAR